jgi:hypothetical protein
MVCVLQYTNGILPMASLAKEKGFRSVFVPAHDAPSPEGWEHCVDLKLVASH